MIKVFVCEDNHHQREYYVELIMKIFQEGKWEGEVYSFSNPYSLLEKCRQNYSLEEKHLYILDIHLSSDMDGIELAKEIRRFDSQGELVFLTTDGEQMPITFRLQLKALDYILKDQEDNLLEAFSRCINQVSKIDHANQHYLVIESKGMFYRYPFQDVMILCTSGKKNIIELHTRQGIEEFRGTLKDILTDYPELLQIHQGILVNPINIMKIDEKNRILTMLSGEQCDIAYRYRRKVLEYLRT
ncbi:LytTR family DNA-binding domain-containing protein [Enterococcus asini]|uniref:LytR/AlgR family response regulator transcription factor n=1 Tax=Enterococcus asini TaxID=57732 RepID=UPI00288D210E|nr:LytTR family DNA-binding domain-containing protein [Enterococcus asini]MDT2758055.1 LytTR family DNA-binding domain-containing protein [Enterococcus asini]